MAWFIQMDGDALAWEIDHYDESANKIVLKQNYSGSGGTDQNYKIFTRANVIWVSNEGYPEAFEPFKFLTGPASELAGDITAGLGYGSGMLFWSQSCMFRLTWETSPQVDPFLVQLSNKYGALNQNTVIEVEGSVYSMDRHGIQMWRGVSPQHISRPVDQEIRDNVAWAQAENFHCVWHPKIRAIRFFVTYTSDTTDANDSSNYPRRYFQYDVDTGNWSTDDER